MCHGATQSTKEMHLTGYHDTWPNELNYDTWHSITPSITFYCFALCHGTHNSDNDRANYRRACKSQHNELIYDTHLNLIAVSSSLTILTASARKACRGQTICPEHGWRRKTVWCDRHLHRRTKKLTSASSNRGPKVCRKLLRVLMLKIGKSWSALSWSEAEAQLLGHSSTYQKVEGSTRASLCIGVKWLRKVNKKCQA